jgi:hypothetical protein
VASTTSVCEKFEFSNNIEGFRIGVFTGFFTGIFAAQMTEEKNANTTRSPHSPLFSGNRKREVLHGLRQPA